MKDESAPAEQPDRAVAKALALVAVVAVAFVLGRSLGIADLDRERARAWAAAQGPWAPIVAVLAYALLTTAAFPAAALTIACGFAFGVVEGALISLVGANLGANGAFLLARALGRDAVARLLGERLRAFEARLAAGRVTLAIGLLRLVPVVPFLAINLGAGVTPGVRWRDFALATLVGMVPGAFLWAVLGGAG